MTRAVPYGLAAVLLAAVAVQRPFAQDAVPFQVAGALWVRGDADVIYRWPMDPAFVEASHGPPDHVTPYVSPPISLPLAMWMSPTRVRLTGALAMAWARHLISSTSP